MLAKAHLLISGKVQDVNFRANIMQRAMTHGVKGWVKNTDDGKVEAVLEGPKEEIEKIIEFCKKGPEGASVDNVEIKWEEPEGHERFERRN